MSGVTFEQTKRKYRGRKAATYEQIRKKQERWELENAAVGDYLRGCRGPVLDVPVGTGRFLDLYKDMGVSAVGIDSSDEMLAQARRKTGGKLAILIEGDAADIEYQDGWFCTTVCVRFLDLIPEDAMLRVLRELMRVTSQRIVLTIRLGDEYVHKSNTCTHDRKKFLRAVSRGGWRVSHSTPVFGQGWEVIKLDPKSKRSA